MPKGKCSNHGGNGAVSVQWINQDELLEAIAKLVSEDWVSEGEPLIVITDYCPDATVSANMESNLHQAFLLSPRG